MGTGKSTITQQYGYGKVGHGKVYYNPAVWAREGGHGKVYYNPAVWAHEGLL